MTLTEVAPNSAKVSAPVGEEIVTAASDPALDRSGTSRGRLDGRRLAMLAVVSLVVLVIAIGVVLYAVGPLIHNRDQRSLMSSERQAISVAAHDNQGLYRAVTPTQPPALGDPLGILAIPAIGLQQAVVEGVGPSQTVSGPGHVPGTAGLGQPGNSALVARRSAYGGPFGELSELRPGDHIVTATTEGQADYVVRSVRTQTLVTRPAAATSSVTTTTLGRPGVTTTTAAAGKHTVHLSPVIAKGPSTVSIQTLYGPSAHNQLTLVTSASGVPWNNDQAVVVVARLQGKPYTPTPQESRSPNQQGNSGDPSSLAWLLLALLALSAVMIGAVALYRRATVRSAYLLTTAPLLALTVLAAEAASHLLPAWL